MKRLLPFLQRYHFVFVFFLLALLIINPFQKGYFFLLDHVTYPVRPIEWGSVFETPLGLFLTDVIGPFILTSALSQKLSFFLSLVLLGTGGFKLGRRAGNAPAYFAGLLAVLNPFIYDRMIEGQINLVISIALFLWGLVYGLDYYQSFGRKDLIIAALFFGLASSFLAHGIFITLLLYLVLFLVHWPSARKKLFYYFHHALSAGIIFLLNINWLIDQLFFKTEKIHFIKNTIDTNQFSVFSPESGADTIYFNILSLHGYWGEGESRFLPSDFFIKNWQIAFFAIFFFVALGVFYGFRKKEFQKDALAFLLLALISYTLSMGIASPHFGFITQWLYDRVPLYKGFRDPQKWSGILLISYLYFSALGIRWFLKWRMVRQAQKIWMIVILALPMLYTSSMLFGFMGQLRALDYPKDWYQLNEQFLTEEKKGPLLCPAKEKQSSTQCYDVLAFPWHQYMAFKFTGRTINNPLWRFFYQIRILQGDNIEIGNIYSQSARPESKVIEFYIAPGQSRQKLAGKDFIKSMTDLGIRYILVAKEVDWENYSRYLTQNPYLKKVWDSDSFIIYEREEIL